MTSISDFQTGIVNKVQEMSVSKNVTKKRTDYMDWEEYFMAIAFLISKRSKDPSTIVGSCIVNSENRIVGQGYNGMPYGCSDDEFPWSKTNDDPLENKYMYVCHAEMNAILNKNCADVRGCRLYTALFPCNECAKMIIQVRMSEVIYASGKNMCKKEGIAAMKMFDAAGVKYRQFIPKKSKVIIDFTEIDQDATQLPPTPLRSSENIDILP